MLNAPWGFLFTCVGVGFGFGVFFPVLVTMLTTRYLWLCRHHGQLVVLSYFILMIYLVFLLSPTKMELPDKVFSSGSVLQEQLCGHREMFGHLQG